MTTPIDEPRTENYDRSISASWPVGEPDAENWQARADLTVTHIKGRGYRATLSTHHEQASGPYVTRTMNLSFDRCRTEIHTAPAARFSRKKLGEIYNLALDQLRQRYESEDDTVAQYFDEHSPVFDYSGAPAKN
ncbi:hypothetical protein [Nocardia vermiculata]|uniref:Uncharacterized protein n=1 Tax=Nocardia vermiculata TaxID=257274 RepID=A0A846Y7W1_9NOCA|nr:hypothetical protein [Nocardia vermiculata]NKY53894.1 hypothetical protein [Nocardia vermiculata]